MTYHFIQSLRAFLRARVASRRDKLLDGNYNLNGCGTKAVGIGERKRNARDVVFMKLTMDDAAVERGVHQRYGRAHVYTVYICEHLTDGTLLVP